MVDNVKMIGKYIVLILFFLVWISFEIRAQGIVKDGLFTDDYRIDPEKEGTLGLSIDNLSFFKNNETDSDVLKGYTLPGFLFQPRLVYQPSSIIKLEAGASLLKFWGTDQYPCYAYQDIAEWKADNYQYGLHILPFFRAQIQPSKQINIVFGTLYGGDNHRLIEPLYNSELNMIADPECGAQFLYNSRVAHADFWINWESFIFRNDTHNEAFTFGASTALHITPESSFFHLSLPAQAVFIHRGGELDTMLGVTTMVNGAAGLKFQFNFNRAALKNISLQALGCFYEDPRKNLQIYTSGRGFYSNLTVMLWNLKMKAAYWYSSDFVNLFGFPIYENVSYSLDERVFPKIEILNGGFSYEQEFGKGFYLGADADFFYNPRLTGYDLTSYGSDVPSKISQSYSYSFGLYLRINPSIVLKK